MSTFTMQAIGHVRGGRDVPDDDHWGKSRARITLDANRFTDQSMQGLDAFSHVEIVFVFDQVDEADVTHDARHPRGNRAWPKVGIFAQRGKNRPNRIGVTVCRIVSLNGLELEVEGLDAIDQTPVLDIKPVMAAFQPRGDIKEPEWAVELMKSYW